MATFNIALMVSGVYHTRVEAKTQEDAIALARAELKEASNGYGNGYGGGYLDTEESYGYPEVDGKEVVEE
jgi:hypothetical protein